MSPRRRKPTGSTDPLRVVLEQLLAEREMTAHALSVEVREQTGWGSSIGISKIMRGELVPGPEGLRHIAAVLGVEPEVFAEYRLGVAREALDWREVGLGQALTNLGELDVEPAPDGAELAGRIKRAERALESALRELQSRRERKTP